MKHFKKNILIAAAALLALSGAAFAQSTTSGWYVGGSVGGSQLKPKLKNSSATIPGTQDTSDVGFKILGGYQFDANWAIESQYQDLGEWKYRDSNYSAKAKVSGLSIAAVGMLPVGNGFTLLGKVGAVRQTFDATAVDTSNASESRKLSKTTPLIGVGAEYTLMPALVLRVEYEYFGVPTLAQSGNEKLQAHTALLSAGLRYRF